jgi:hypothetical protein
MRRLILPLFMLVAAAPVAIAQESAPSAPKTRTFTWSSSENSDRAMLGIATGSSGRRDTLGLFIESITDGGPADKAGLEEGNRIASINGVNLKVAREDAGESDMAGAMTNRLIREMRKIKAGDDVTLQVWADGHYKTVKVKTVAAKDLESRDDGAGDFAFAMNDMPRLRAQLQDELPRIREDIRSQMPLIREDIQNEMPRIREELRNEMPRVRAEIENELPRIHEQLDNELPQAMEEMRRSMDRMRLQVPQLTMRVRHRVII